MSFSHISGPFCGPQTGDDAGDTVPVLSFGRQLPTTASRDGVELCFPIVVGNPPARRDPSLLLKTHQRCVYGSLIQRQHGVADLLDPTRDPVAVQWTHGVESARPSDRGCPATRLSWRARFLWPPHRS